MKKQWSTELLSQVLHYFIFLFIGTSGGNQPKPVTNSLIQHCNSYNSRITIAILVWYDQG